ADDSCVLRRMDSTAFVRLLLIHRNGTKTMSSVSTTRRPLLAPISGKLKPIPPDIVPRGTADDHSKLAFVAAPTSAIRTIPTMGQIAGAPRRAARKHLAPAASIGSL